MINLKDYIAIIEDFPVKGISFKDITPLIGDKEAFKASIEEMAAVAKQLNPNVVVGPESRGFIFGCPLALKMGLGFVPIRKPGKLPRKTVEKKYDLEYGSNTLCMHSDALKKGDKVIIVDDLLATGGTIKAAIDLIRELGAEVVGCVFLIELTELKGRDLFKDIPTYSILQYPY